MIEMPYRLVGEREGVCRLPTTNDRSWTSSGRVPTSVTTTRTPAAIAMTPTPLWLARVYGSTTIEALASSCRPHSPRRTSRSPQCADRPFDWRRSGSSRSSPNATTAARPRNSAAVRGWNPAGNVRSSAAKRRRRRSKAAAGTTPTVTALSCAAWVTQPVRRGRARRGRQDPPFGTRVRSCRLGRSGTSIALCPCTCGGRSPP